MPSNIDDTKPVQGNPTTQSMRANFTTARDEISALQTGQTTANTNINLKAQRAGDLGGTTTSTTVIRLQGRNMASTAPATGQALVWDGTQWAPGATGGVGYLPTTGGTISGPLQIGTNPS